MPKPLRAPDPSSEQSPKRLRAYMELMEGDHSLGIGSKGDKRAQYSLEAIELGLPLHKRLRPSLLGPKLKKWSMDWAPSG